jgi:hypothetical protein
MTMALVLSLRTGQDFFVGNEQFMVHEIESPLDFTLIHIGKDRKYQITDEEATEIMPGVKVSAGDKAPTLAVRITIQADRSIPVVRGDKRREQLAENALWN